LYILIFKLPREHIYRGSKNNNNNNNNNNGLTVTGSFLHTFPRLPVADAALLVAPLFPRSALDKAWSDRCAELTRAVDRLQAVGSQEALILLRASFSAPKVLHLLRCSPSASHSALLDFDSLLRTAIERITNSSLTDSQWLQASLPVRDGGLGVRRLSSLAIPVFWLQRQVPSHFRMRSWQTANFLSAIT